MPYSGEKSDIFSMGVVLFILVTGSPPFIKGKLTDPYYKLLSRKKTKIFWKAHSRRKPKDYFTEDFKDLIEKMLEYDPNKRIAMKEIQEHPWFIGQTPSQSELLDYMSKLQV